MLLKWLIGIFFFLNQSKACYLKGYVSRAVFSIHQFKNIQDDIVPLDTVLVKYHQSPGETCQYLFNKE